MGHAIANTFKSVAGSSVTTVAGFLALCVMTFSLGRDLGIVMAKGVLIGVVCCVTVLPLGLLSLFCCSDPKACYQQAFSFLLPRRSVSFDSESYPK